MRIFSEGRVDFTTPAGGHLFVCTFCDFILFRFIFSDREGVVKPLRQAVFINCGFIHTDQTMDNTYFSVDYQVARCVKAHLRDKSCSCWALDSPPCYLFGDAIDVELSLLAYDNSV